MHVLELAKSRKTVRIFKKDKPEKSLIEKAIEVAKEAPSGMNAQPWFFVVVESESVKTKIRKSCEKAEKTFYEKVSGSLGSWLKEKGFSYEKPFLSEAPYLIVVFGNSKAPFWIQSVWISVGYLLLALEELNLSSVTYTPPNPKDVQDILKMKNPWKLQVIIPVGYSNDPKEKFERKDLSDVLRFV